jgi:8-oxo-dGTP pyrophosphatase MutT (NUDIX family)
MNDPSAARLPVVALERVEMSFAPRPWPFAIERRAEIDACFAQLQREKPALWNGRVLMMYQHTISAGKLRGAFLETDFASLLAWRAFDFPDPTIKVCFPMSALHSTDGAFLLGLMAPHTANAGQLYFPTGTPDPDDVRGDKVDFDDSLLRELVEETGLGPADVTAVPGWHAVLAGPRIALIKLLQVAAPAASLRARILAHLAREPEPELCDIVIVRDHANLDPRMPAFVTAFLTDFWSKRAP